MVALTPLPKELKDDLAAYTGCLAGTALVNEIEDWLAQAGFERIDVQIKRKSGEFLRAEIRTGKVEHYVASADVTAWKPALL
jgi:arsenite methyltransferase